MTKKGHRKIAKFPIHVREFIDASLDSNVCFTCLSKVLYLQYGIQVSWKTIRTYESERKTSHI